MLARNKTVWACCSCCEIIFGDANVEHTTVSKLPDTFRVTSEEKRVRFGMISAEIRQAHFQVIVKGDIWYHLNPDLVLASTGQSEDGTDEDARVVLCKRCSGNPRKNKYSIASGHDYGRRGNLSDLNDVATNCISPIRLFGIEIALSGRFAHGHSICFPADGPIKCSSELPQVDEDCHPHVTFVGPHDQWRVISKSFRHLYDIPVDDVYAWLEVLSATHSYWREEDAVIGESGDLEHVIPIERSSSPVTEWTSNGDILAGAFPTLFMTGGAMLPQGSLPQDFVDHLMVYYDGRFEQSVTLIATMFNQLQRHSAIQKTARIGSLHGEALLKLTDLANNPLFRQQLEVAHAHPDSKLAKILNTKLLRILSIAGDTVPFSPFELANALQKSARARLQISNRYPALAVRAFEEAFDVVTTGLIRCRASKDVRKSHDYGERERGVLSAVVGFAAVVEPQKCGRLHTHMTVYSSTWTPQLLVRSVCHPELQDLAKQWIDSVSRTYLSDNIWDRFNQLKSPDGKVESHLQRSSEMVLPDAASDYNKFDTIAQLCLLGTNLHHHSSTCIKGRRGKFMCRLNRPAGVFNYETAPVELTLLKNGALWKGERGIVEASSVSENTKSIIDVGYCTEEDGHLLRQSTERPVVWEQRRPSRDSMVVETNLPLSLLSRSHTNASIISCEDAGDSVQEYQRNYMTKDSGGLQNTASIFMAAVDEVRKYPSSADDRESPLRQAKYLACRTVNAFAGAHEWPLSVMIYALRGHHSFISSDVYWYIFPWSFVRHLENIDERVDGSCFQYGNRVECDEDIDEDSVMDPQIEQQLDDIICSVENEVRQVRRAMEDVDRENMFSSNDDTCHDSGTISGARSFTLKGKTVFVSQVQSYVHRGKHFSDFSPAEFESIVDVRLVKSGNEKLSKKSRGRKRRDGFAFAPTHPLYPHYEGCIRVKFKTPMLGGAPPPNYKVALRKPHLMDQLAK
ncbi:Hypothetical protein PHPALM_17604 [Phytophthora palmivora]|uniref:DUF6570 domain-containing protein n=1 Tax=Phytophthora palmivora TaxID=4796 RepID=A0A2P4XLT7_9STRA|nr:Hypothetical protein PHPALM_17604 [Phytophthora palmivora]